MITKEHYIDLVDGKFHDTTPTDLDTLFAALEQSAAKDHIVVHFHGGLVSRKNALDRAEKLQPVYESGNAYPVFFIWNSDVFTEILANLDEIAQEDVFNHLVKKVLQLVSGKIGAAAGGRGIGDTLQFNSIKNIPSDPKALAEYARQQESNRGGAEITPLSANQEKQIEQEFAADLFLQQFEQAIIGGSDVGGRGATKGAFAPVKTKMSKAVIKDITATAGAGGSAAKDKRGIGVILTLAKYGVQIVSAVINRFIHKRDHGLLTTLEEEILRVLYIDTLGGLMWKMMKQDTGDAFANNPACGGTAFVEAIARWWKPGRRVTLVGHSTGAIYIGNFLGAADALMPPEARFGVVFLAPACSFDFLAEKLPVFTKRVGTQARLFALNGTVESSYWEVPVLYYGSLLYMVSGLFENPVVDQPIVGMQRYYSASGPYDLQPIKDIAAYFDGKEVWSPQEDTPDGWKSSAKRHGDFDTDKNTLASLTTILKQGF